MYWLSYTIGLRHTLIFWRQIQQYTDGNTRACWARSHRDTEAVISKHCNLTLGGCGEFWLFLKAWGVPGVTVPSQTPSLAGHLVRSLLIRSHRVLHLCWSSSIRIGCTQLRTWGWLKMREWALSTVDQLPLTKTCKHFVSLWSDNQPEVRFACGTSFS